MFASTVQKTMTSCLDSIATGDEESFAACLNPGIHLFGAFLGREVNGVAAAIQAFRGVRTRMGLRKIRVLQQFGRDREMALLCAFELEGRSETAKAVLLLSFDPEDRIVRMAALWEPEIQIPAGDEDLVSSLVWAFNEGNGEKFVANMTPDVEYFGTMTGVEVEGIPSIKGAFNGARDTMGVRSLEVLHLFGRSPYLGVLMRFLGEGGAPTSEGILGIFLNDQGRIIRLTVIWDPGPFLRR